jgi:hypothetical protein
MSTTMHIYSPHNTSTKHEPSEPLTRGRIIMLLLMVALVATLLITPMAVLSQHAGGPADDCAKRAATVAETTGQAVATSCK